MSVVARVGCRTDDRTTCYQTPRPCNRRSTAMHELLKGRKGPKGPNGALAVDALIEVASS